MDGPSVTPNHVDAQRADLHETIQNRVTTSGNGRKIRTRYVGQEADRSLALKVQFADHRRQEKRWYVETVCRPTRDQQSNRGRSIFPPRHTILHRRNWKEPVENLLFNGHV